MKTRVFISFNAGEARRHEVVRLLRRAIGSLDGLCDASSVAPGYFATFFGGDDPVLSSLRSALEQAGISWFERREYIYTPRELRAAPMLVFQVRTAERDTGHQAADRFDFSRGCPRCHTGSPQIASWLVPAGALPRKTMVCQTLEHQYFVAEPLRRALVAAELTGLDLVQISSRSGKALPWWQMIARQEFPPMAGESRGIIRGSKADGTPMDGCQVCQRDNWFDSAIEPAQYVYYKSQFDGKSLPDAARTHECFGISGLDVNGYIAHGKLLVSPRVYNVFRSLKVRGIEFLPVTILER